MKYYIRADKRMYTEILKFMHETFKILFDWISKVSKYIYDNDVLISKIIIVNIKIFVEY